MSTPNKNKYSKGTHISERKFRQLIKCFSLDLNAYETSKITNISHTTCKKIFQKLRVYIYQNLLENNIYDGEFELDESYFGAKRVRGKRGRGAVGKTPVFGLLKISPMKMLIKIHRGLNKSLKLKMVDDYLVRDKKK